MVPPLLTLPPFMTSQINQFTLRLVRRGILLGLVAVVFSAGFLAVMPQVHRCLHAHADQAEHHCWLTECLDQTVLLAGLAPEPAPAIFSVLPLARTATLAVLRADAESFPPRGPPPAASALA